VRLVALRLQANSNAIRNMNTGVAKTMTLLMAHFRRALALLDAGQPYGNLAWHAPY
jgi:hypothetical protein